MRKTSVYLTEEESVRLVALAKREGASQAEVVRRAIRTYAPRQPADRDFAIVGAGEGPGGSVADIPDDELIEGFGT